MYEYQIGISYASEQEKMAERLCNLLTNKGIKVFFAKKDENQFLASNNLYAEIIDTYENKCKYIVAIISEEYINKDYTNQELSVAIQKKNSGERCLIPIYTSSKRHPNLSNDDYYINYEQKKNLR